MNTFQLFDSLLAAILLLTQPAITRLDHLFAGTHAGAGNTGISNSFVGSDAGCFNTITGSNAFCSAGAGFDNQTGGDNAFFGFEAGNPANLSNLTNAAAIGHQALVSRSNARQMQQVAPYIVGKFLYQDITGKEDEYLNYGASALTYMPANPVHERKKENEVLRQENVSRQSKRMDLAQRFTQLERRVPAEWEAQESVWMAWPTYNNKHDWDAETIYAQLLKTLIARVPVNLCVADAAMQKKVQTYLQSKGIAADQFGTRICFRVIDYGDIWLRDTGPVFVHQGKQLLAVDFNFDCWGWGSFVKDSRFPGFIQLEEQVDRTIAGLVNLTAIRSQLVLEGGALEFNGKGTVIVSEDVVFQRNPTWNKAQVEAEFGRLFGTQKIIWLKGFVGNDAHPVIHAPYQMTVQGSLQPVYTLMTTNGHTDEFVRFTSSNTLLLAQPPSAQEAAQDPVAARSRKTLLDAQRVLSSSTDQDGQPLLIRYMPETRFMPVTLDAQDEIYQLMTDLDFERVGKPNIEPTKPMTGVLASSYLNYLVTNNLVLVAKYGDLYPDMAAKDAEAVQVLQQAFPGRQVVALDVRAINVGGGGIHCITKQMPKRGG